MGLNLPDGVEAFLASAGWGDGVVEPLAGDTSFRRYFRVRTTEGGSCIIMDAPPAQEDCAPFVKVAGLMADAGLNAPRVLAWDQAQVTEASMLVIVCARLDAWEKDAARVWAEAPQPVQDEGPAVGGCGQADVQGGGGAAPAGDSSSDLMRQLQGN